MESARVGDQPRILSDHLDDGAFTSELCKVLTNLAKTPGGEFTDLAVDFGQAQGGAAPRGRDGDRVHFQKLKKV